MCSRWCHKNIRKATSTWMKLTKLNRECLNIFFPLTRSERFSTFLLLLSHQPQTQRRFCFLLLWPSTAQEISFSFRKIQRMLDCRRQKLSFLFGDLHLSSARSKDQLRKFFISRRRCSLIYFVFNFYYKTLALFQACPTHSTLAPLGQQASEGKKHEKKRQRRETRGELSWARRLCICFA